DLLAKNLIRPGNLELWVMDADGGHKHQVTHNGTANFAPYWLPDGKRIIFASNMADPKNGRDFDLYVINEDETGLERVTYHPGFDGDRKSTRLNSSHLVISYAVFCLKKKTPRRITVARTLGALVPTSLQCRFAPDRCDAARSAH